MRISLIVIGAIRLFSSMIVYIFNLSYLYVNNAFEDDPQRMDDFLYKSIYATLVCRSFIFLADFTMTIVFQS